MQKINLLKEKAFQYVKKYSSYSETKAIFFTNVISIIILYYITKIITVSSHEKILLQNRKILWNEINNFSFHILIEVVLIIISVSSIYSYKNELKQGFVLLNFTKRLIFALHIAVICFLLGGLLIEIKFITSEWLINCLFGGIVYFLVHFPFESKKMIQVSNNYRSWYVLYIFMIIYIFIFTIISIFRIAGVNSTHENQALPIALCIFIVIYCYTHSYVHNKFKTLA